MAIDVVVEVDGAVSGHNHRSVNDQHRDGPRQVHLLVVGAAGHRCADLLRGPAGIIAQHPDGEVGGTLQANAAMTEIAARAREQLLLGRIVHVDAVIVGENKLDQSQ